MINKDEMLKLISSSRLEFSEYEIPKLMKDMESIMEFTEKVAEYNYSDLHCDCPVEKRRIDESVDLGEFTREEILSGAISKNGFFFIKNSN